MYGYREFEDAVIVEEWVVEVNVIPDGSIPIKGAAQFDLSPLLAGDLSPSNKMRVGILQAAGHGFAWPASRPGGQSGDKSPHSKSLSELREPSPL